MLDAEWFRQSGNIGRSPISRMSRHEGMNGFFLIFSEMAWYERTVSVYDYREKEKKI